MTSCSAELFLLFCTIVLLHSHVNGNIEREFDYFKEDIERYVSTLVRKATTSLSRVDHIDLEDTEEIFRTKISFIDFQRGYRTYNNKLRGLSSLYKDGGVGTTWQTEDHIVVEVNLGFNDLRFESDARVWWGHLGKKFFMSANVENAKVTVDMRLPLTTTGSGVPVATSVVVRDMGRMTFDVNGLGPFSWLFEAIAYVQRNRLRKVFKDGVESLLLDTINQELGKIQVPELKR